MSHENIPVYDYEEDQNSSRDKTLKDRVNILGIPSEPIIREGKKRRYRRFVRLIRRLERGCTSQRIKDAAQETFDEYIKSVSIMTNHLSEDQMKIFRKALSCRFPIYYTALRFLNVKEKT